MKPARGRRLLLAGGTLLAVAPLGLALSGRALAALSETDAASGIRAALERGSLAAVSRLGATDGFWGNPKVRIPLPDTLQTVRSAAKLFGMDRQFRELELTINRAAEAAVPEAKELVVQAARQVSVKDAIDIVRGGDDSVTQYFRRTTGDALAERFLPIVSRQTARLNLAQQYDRIAAKGARLGLVKEDTASLDRYVTGKAVDGLFQMIAEEERAIRRDPIGTGSSILRKVFGGL